MPNCIKRKYIIGLQDNLPPLQTKRGPICTPEWSTTWFIHSASTRVFNKRNAISVSLLVLKLSSWMCRPILDRVVHYKRSQSLLCITRVCIDSRVQMDQFFPIPSLVQLNSVFVGGSDLTCCSSLFTYKPPLSYFLWNMALDAIWLHAGISEREDTWTREEWLPSVGSQRSIFFNKYIHWMILFLLKERHYGYPTCFSNV